MYFLWDVRGIAMRLKKNRLSSLEVAIYCFLSPLLSLSNGLFFGFLLFSHQIIEYSFQGWLGKAHPLLDYYNIWSLGMTFLTIFISFTGIFLCYRANKKGDGKDFWKRLACLSFPINFHIVLYSLALLFITLIVATFALHNKVLDFQESIWPTKTVPANPFGLFLGGIFKTVFSVLKLPEASRKVTAFLGEIRGIIMLGYPVLSIIPPLLSLAHYLIVRRFIRIIARPTTKKEVS